MPANAGIFNVFSINLRKHKLIKNTLNMPANAGIFKVFSNNLRRTYTRTPAYLES